MNAKTPNYKRYIFLSHAEEDSEIAHSLAQKLKRFLAAEVYLDKYFLSPGSRWKDEIRQNISSSEILIVLTSRVVAGKLAHGVTYELEIAAQYNVPVIVGMIRNQPIPSEYEDFQCVNFGEKGEREEGVWEIARFLIANSSPFSPLGVAGIFPNKDAASAIIGSTESIAQGASSIIVVGHTLKAWLADYGNIIRYSKANVTLLLPSDDDPGMQYLQCIHRRGSNILQSIQNTKKAIRELLTELPQIENFKCFELKIKPMFSAMAVDVDLPTGWIVIDHYLFRIPSEHRPRMILRGTQTPIFALYKKIILELAEEATTFSK